MGVFHNRRPCAFIANRAVTLSVVSSSIRQIPVGLTHPALSSLWWKHSTRLSSLPECEGTLNGSAASPRPEDVWPLHQHNQAFSLFSDCWQWTGILYLKFIEEWQMDTAFTTFWVFLHSDEEFSCFVLWCQLLCPKLNGTRWRLLRSSYLFVLPICKHSGNHVEARRQLEIPRIMKLVEFGATTTKKTQQILSIQSLDFCVKKKYQPLKKKVWNQKLFILWLTIKSCII